MPYDIEAEEVILIEIYGNYTTVTLDKRDYIRTKKSIAYWERYFHSSLLVRCHKCCLVNVLYCIRIGTSYVELYRGYRAPLSRRGKRLLVKRIKEMPQEIM